MHDLQQVRGRLLIYNQNKMSQAMNPRESAAFIASIAHDVKIDPLGIQNVAKEVIAPISL